MFTAAMIRIASLSAWLALAALTSSRAAAELPEHPVAAQARPISEDFDFEDPNGPPITFNLQFGDTVAMRNGVAFVRIPLAHGGRVAVLNQTTSGGWRRVQTLHAPIPDAGFGRTITWRDGLVIVGDETTAYVYKRNSNLVWTLRQTLRPPAADSVVLFPAALKYEAGTLLASAVRDALPGLVYVFERGKDGRFVRRARLRALDGRPFDGFGSSLSMTKTTLVMGSSGAAYVFSRDRFGNWVQSQKLVPAGTALGFGSSVAIDQGMIIVGAPFEDLETDDTPDGHWAEGAAYVFLPVAGRYLESLRLRPRIDEKFAYRTFGRQVAMFGRYIAISAVGPPTFVGNIAAEGIVFTYTRDGSTVLARGIASAHLESFSANISMALANNWLMVGHFGDERCPFGCPGEATVYDVNRFRQ